MTTCRALETTYNGCRFRSRAEARWAVYLDRLGLGWDYERQGYKLPDGSCYLCDFWVPDLRVLAFHEPGLWLEVKGEQPTLPELDRCWRLGVGLAQPVTCAVGAPHGPRGALLRLEYPWRENHLAVMRCYRCGDTFLDSLERNEGRCPFCGYDADEYHPELVWAAEQARSARFARAA